MRNNQPVSKQETVIPDGVFIYSRTNLKGIIIEVNEAFAQISGYLPEEMVGEPHNLIRHPDMPAQAFADMWKNLKQGRPWKGIVKNRRKDGGFYWVVANASPVREAGAITGYQSVRTRPTREQIAVAEVAYARLRGGDSSLRVEDGRIVKNHSPLVTTLLSFNTRIYAAIGLALLTGLCGILAGYLGYAGMARLNVIMSVLLLLVSVYMLIFFLPGSFRRMDGIDSFMDNALSTGDITRNMASQHNDAIGRICAKTDTLVSALRATLQIIADNTRAVGEASELLGRNVSHMLSAADRQSSATSSAAAGIEEMTVSISEVARNAADTRNATTSAGEKAREGSQLSDNATDAISALARIVADSADKVEQFSKRAEEVSRVASVIKEIADQTNLVALNAAIEAARAGELGRGFAVVADEVRKLAERTTSATGEIEQMISRIQEDTGNAVSGMMQSAEQVGIGVDLVRRAQAALQEINTQMIQTGEMISYISHSSAEQSSGMTTMAQNVEQVAQLTAGNLTVARSTDAAANDLQKYVERMQKAVGLYKV